MLPPPTSFSPIPGFLVTTTRGATPSVRGWLSIFPLDDEGLFADDDIRVERYETPTSGGKANAIDLLPKSSSGLVSDGRSKDSTWILLTDDDDATAGSGGTGAVRVLEWDGWATGGVKSVAEWPGRDDDEQNDTTGQRIEGASHAIWLD